MAKQQQRPIIKCIECGEMREHGGHKMCWTCYRRWKREIENPPGPAVDRHAKAMERKKAHIAKHLAGILHYLAELGGAGRDHPGDPRHHRPVVLARQRHPWEHPRPRMRLMTKAEAEAIIAAVPRRSSASTSNSAYGSALRSCAVGGTPGGV
jgi:hypothetical protein